MMTPEIEFRLMAIEAEFNSALTIIHDKFLRNMDWLARSTGQRLRTDRLP